MEANGHLIPEPVLGPQTLLDYAASELGVSVGNLSRRCRFVGWTYEDLERWTTDPTWKTKLEERVDALIPIEATKRSWFWLRQFCMTSRIVCPDDVEATVRSAKILKSAREYERGGMLMCGPTGIGKSMAMLLMAQRAQVPVMARGVRVLLDSPEPGKGLATLMVSWHRALDLSNARAETRLGGGEPESVQDAKECSLLLLDDVGWESSRAGSGDVISEVVATRYDRGLETIVTTGQRVEDFVARYGAAFVRRIQEAGGRSGKVIDAWNE